MREARWLWLSLAVLAADRATKYAIERTSPLFRHSIVSDIVVLVHSQNPGIAFSMFSESKASWLTPLLVGSSVLVMILLVWVIVTGRAGGAMTQCGLALILGGAAGNALDRVLHGSVTDFMEVRLWTYIWPAFNVADSAITIGAILVLCELLFAGRQPHAPASEKRGRA
jgi:signal peptidase II